MKKRILSLLLALLMLLSMVPVSAIAEGNVDYYANKEKKARFLYDLNVSAAPEQEVDWSSATQVPLTDVSDLVVIIDDCKILVEQDEVWYKVRAQEGETLPEALQDMWIFHDTYSTSLGATIEFACGICDQFGCTSAHENWCEICKKDDCGEDHTATEPTEPEPTDPSEPDNSCACCESCTGAEGCQCLCGGCDFCQPEESEIPSISATVIDINGNEQTVTVSGDALPEGAKLEVTPVENEAAVLEETAIENGFIWDIKVFDGNGDAWQPSGGKSVKVTLPVSNMEDSTYVLLYHLLETTEAVSAAIAGGAALESSVGEFGSSFGSAAAPAVAAYRQVTGSTDDSFVVEKLTPQVINGAVSFETSSFSVWVNGGVWQRYSNANSSNEIVVADNGGTTFYAPVGQAIYFDTGAGTTGAYKWRASLNGTTTDSGNIFSYTSKLLSDRSSNQAKLSLSSSNVKVGDTIKVWFDGSASAIKNKVVTIIVVNEVQVTLNENRGTNLGSDTLSSAEEDKNKDNSKYRFHIWYGSTVVSYAKTPKLTATGYIHTGWNTKKDGTGTEIAIGSNYAPTSNITLYAQWTYDVTYSINGGTGTSATQTINTNNTVTIHSAPTRSGYTFLGWYSSADGVVYNAGATYTAKKPTIMTALWGKQDSNSSWNHNFYVLPGTAAFSEHLKTIDGTTKANPSTTIARPDIVADSNTYYVAPNTTMTFGRTGGSWCIDSTEAGITSSVGTSWTASDSVTVTISGSAAVGTTMMLYSRSTTGTAVNCARIIVKSKQEITTMAIEDDQDIYRVGLYILRDSTKIPGEPNYTTGIQMINVNGGMNYSPVANGIVFESIANAGHYDYSLDGSCTMGVVDYSGGGTVPYLAGKALDDAMDRVISELNSDGEMIAVGGANLTALYKEKGEAYIRANFVVRPHVIKLMTGLSYNELGWHVDCAIYPQKTVTLTYNLNPPAGYALKSLGTPAPGIHTGDVEAAPAEFTVTGNIQVGNTYTASVSGSSDTANLTFTGWNTKADGTGDSYTPSNKIAISENTTLYAQWSGGEFNTGTMEVEKKVSVTGGSELPGEDSFQFAVNLSGDWSYSVYNGQTGAQESSGTMTDGTFTLKGGQFIRFTGVPVANYIITENLSANYSNEDSTQTITLKGGYTNRVVFVNIYSKITVGIENGYDGKLYPELPEGLENVTYRWYRDSAEYSYTSTYWENAWTVVDSQYIDANGSVDVISHGGYVHENDDTVSGTKYRYKLELLDADENVIAENIYVVNFGDRILNSSFEATQIAEGVAGAQYPNGTENLFWASTDEDPEQKGRDVEIRASGFKTFYYKNAGDLKQFAEINAETSTSLYQDVVSNPGNGLTWTLGHSARPTTGTDEMFVIITSSLSARSITSQSEVNAMIEAAKSADALDGETDVTYAGVTFRIWRLESAFVDVDTWTQYAGHYTVPAGQRMTRFFFAAGETASGNDTIGNLIDGVKFNEAIYYVVNYYLNGELVPGASISASGSEGEVITPDLVTFAQENNAELNADSEKTLTLSSNKTNVLNLYYRSNYSVTGEIANGTVTNKNQTVIHGNSSTAMVFTPTTGYKITKITVNGKEQTIANENSYTYSAQSSVTSDIKVIVTTAKKTFTVTFVDEDATTVLKAATEYEYGTAAADIVKPADPTKDSTDEFDYKFAGWTPEIADVTSNATYKATYSSTVRKHLLSGAIDHGTVSDPVWVEYGTTNGQLVFKADPGYYMVSYHNSNTNETSSFTPNSYGQNIFQYRPWVRGNTVITMKTAPIPYTIAYNHNDDDTNPTKVTASYDIEDALALAEAPTREGYKFTGWKLQTAGGNWIAGDYTAGQVIGTGKYGNITLEAQWEAQYRYVLNYNGNTTDTVGNMPTNVDSGWVDATKYTADLSATPTRANYDFMGWATSKDATAADVLSNYELPGIAHDTASATLYAVWQRQTGDLKLTFNGGKTAPAIVTVSGQGKTITLVLTKAETVIMGLPTGTYEVTVESGNASYVASVKKNPNPTIENKQTAVVEITTGSKGLNWFTAFYWVKNKFGMQN